MTLPQNLQLCQTNFDISRIEYDRLWQFLSADERSRANRFKYEHLKHKFVVARGNLRILLAKSLSCEPKAIQIYYTDRGKPYVRGIYFNLAHSENFVIYAICGDREVGIDLEYINPQCKVESIANRYFLPAEQEKIQRLGKNLSDRDKYLAFYRAWTLKEAYAKATGQGIASILSAVDTSPLLEIPIIETPMGATLQIGDWTLKLLTSELEIDPSCYVAALCLSNVTALQS